MPLQLTAQRALPPGNSFSWSAYLYHLLCTQNIEKVKRHDPTGMVELKRYHLPGIYLTQWKSQFNKQITISQTTTEGYFFMQFMLKGKISYHFPFASGHLCQGENNIWGLPAGSKGSILFEAKQECEFWTCLLLPNYVRELKSKHPYPLRPLYQKYCKGEPCCLKAGNLYNRAETSHIMWQIKEAFSIKQDESLLIEAKVLELLGRQLQGCSIPSYKAKGLLSCEKKQIQLAADYLLEDLFVTPGIHELARKVGLSATKLKYGFRELFGSTVHGYQQEFKLSLAHRLMYDREKNISEIAFECGYEYPSHFSKAFKQRYKLSPREFRRRMGN